MYAKYPILKKRDMFSNLIEIYNSSKYTIIYHYQVEYASVYMICWKCRIKNKNSRKKTVEFENAMISITNSVKKNNHKYMYIDRCKL